MVYSKELLTQYLKELVERYESMQNEEYSFGSRLRLRREIEGTRALLEDFYLDTAWENLSKVFGTTAPRPDFGAEYENLTEEDNDKFDQPEL